MTKDSFPQSDNSVSDMELDASTGGAGVSNPKGSNMKLEGGSYDSVTNAGNMEIKGGGTFNNVTNTGTMQIGGD